MAHYSKSGSEYKSSPQKPFAAEGGLKWLKQNLFSAINHQKHLAIYIPSKTPPPCPTASYGDLRGLHTQRQLSPALYGKAGGN